MIHTQDPDFTLICADVLDGLRSLPDESVHCVVTSPPFYGLRDYGMDGQIGLESSPEVWASRLVEVFREARRVLRSDGSLWIECGDSYNSATSTSRSGSTLEGSHGYWENPHIKRRINAAGLKPKDLLGQPFLLAFALRADGWYWRGCYPWAKPNAMPESAKDRCTTSHSYVLHFAKSARYYFDGDAISEPAAWERWGDQTVVKDQPGAASWIQPKSKRELQGELDHRYAGLVGQRWKKDGRNGNGQRERSDEMSGFDERLERADGRKHPRSVWTIPTQGYPNAHFATYPEELVRRCILAATSERGCCPVCGTPWEREMETSYEKSPVHGAGLVVGRHYETGANNFDGAGMPRLNKKVETLGWRPGCDCGDERGVVLLEELPPIPCTVLDPFLGSGTTAYVARKHGRRSIGIELNPEYADLAAKRMQQQSLFA